MVSEWNKNKGDLPINAEVTVYGELAGEKLNKDSFWAIVTDVSQSAEGIYGVTDSDEKKTLYPKVTSASSQET